MENCGYLHVFTGPMFSGKTSKLISTLTLLSDVMSENKIILINSIKDNRDEFNILSCHSSGYKGLSEKVKVFKCENLSDINIYDYDVIGIDECNFFDDLYETVKYWISLNKEIYCSGLDGNYKMETFGKIHLLLPIADSFIKYNAICSICSKKKLRKNAAFSKRIIDSDSEILVGGSELYVSVCRNCHIL